MNEVVLVFVSLFEAGFSSFFCLHWMDGYGMEWIERVESS